MNRVRPLVSVVIPTYNRRPLVSLAVESALQQSYQDVEVIVGDDGSSDGTEDELKRAFGSRIKYFWQINQGESATRNHAISLSTGKYIAFLDSDDLWLPHKLEKQLPLLDDDAVVAVGCRAVLVDIAGNRLSSSILASETNESDYSLESLLYQNTFSGGSSALIRRSALETVGGFDATIRYGEDWDLWLRLRFRGEFRMVQEPLVCIRRHTDTQCHLPRGENVRRILEDHLRLLNKAFESGTGIIADLDKLRGRSLGRQYAEAAFAAYAWGEADQGREWLEHALEYDRVTWEDANRAKAQLTNYLVARTEVEGGCDVEGMRAAVWAAAAHWSATISAQRRFVNQVVGAALADAGYRAYLKGEFTAARRHTWMALRSDSGLWSDRGLLKRLVTSLRQERTL